jgi:cytosine deaminase
VVVDASTPAAAVAEIAQPLFGLKAGRETFNRPLPAVSRPLAAAAE